MSGLGRKRWGITAGAALAVAIALARATPPGPVEVAREIPRGQKVEAELKPAESHRYRVTLAAGFGVKAVAAQSGIDVVLSLRAPDGAEIARAGARWAGFTLQGDWR